jgi:hypothetical protein
MEHERNPCVRPRPSSMAVLLAMLAALAAPTAAAQDTPPGKKWVYEFTPYLWAAGLKGDIGVGRLTAPVDVNFGDILSDLDFGLLGAFEARTDRWGLLFNTVYLELSDDSSGGRVEAHQKQLMLEAAGTFRLGQNPKGRWDGLLGLRYQNLDLKLQFPGTEVDGSKSWVDPILGVRYMGSLSRLWFMRWEGDIGGFGVGSDFTWNTSLLLGYRLSSKTDLVIGYRYMDVDFEDATASSTTPTPMVPSWA